MDNIKNLFLKMLDPLNILKGILTCQRTVLIYAIQSQCIFIAKEK